MGNLNYAKVGVAVPLPNCLLQSCIKLLLRLTPRCSQADMLTICGFMDREIKATFPDAADMVDQATYIWEVDRIKLDLVQMMWPFIAYTCVTLE